MSPKKKAPKTPPKKKRGDRVLAAIKAQDDEQVKLLLEALTRPDSEPRVYGDPEY